MHKGDRFCYSQAPAHTYRRGCLQMRAALYARVSTVDKGQDPEVQLRDLREYAARRGLEAVAEFVDFASGARNGRPEYQRMFDAARKRRFDVLLVWRYDRFARSMQELVNALEEFRTLGIDFISYRENADTTTAQGKLIFGIMASLAEFERALIAERVRAGMARAKAQGKHVGRPRIPTQTEAAIRRDLLAGRSLRSTIKAHEVGSKTVQRIKAELVRQSTRAAPELR
jgi:DNA invertase Pin-like site-specific DNA recombinase